MSKTVSLEMARRLRSAGLKWEPKPGDKFTGGDYSALVVGSIKYPNAWHLDFFDLDEKKHRNLNSSTLGIYIYLPTTDDLLGWLEATEYERIVLELTKGYQTPWSCNLWESDIILAESFDAATAPDAAGEAAIWVMGQGK